ncbi:MAG: CO dehydrogenase/CO-methylating acetyl-CoA synthase complex subunit beta [Firmicutes bacterium]|nr:CO dehydrogenase/CO-methylating acetyl-CoA synthase complex subunit beta [Bacillota bacterium]
MSKLIATRGILGAHSIVNKAEAKLHEAMDAKGPNEPVEFPNTGYYLPVIYGLTGMKVEKLADMEPVLKLARELLPEPPRERVWLPYLGPLLDAGIATLFAEEIHEACRYVVGPPPAEGIWLGAATDVIMRERGVEFVDGRAPGFAAVVGAAPDNETAVKLAREMQQKSLYVFMAGHDRGRSFAQQLADEGVQLGWESRLVPFGEEVYSQIYSMGFATRAAMAFGGIAPGDYQRILRYNKNRIFAFVIALGEVTDEWYATAAGAISYGFPTIADSDIPQILPTGVCTYEHVVSNVPHDKIVNKAIEVRGLKIKITEVPIPVAFGPAFEGETVRKVDAYFEAGGGRSPAFELVESAPMEEVEDGRITLIGPDLDQVPEGSVLPLGILVRVAGRKMQEDFEPVLERRIHYFINYAEGAWHTAQRDLVWVRISKKSQQRGLRIRHFGDILYTQFKSEFLSVVDKVEVTLITEEARVRELLTQARQRYAARDARLAGLTDEAVDTFYSCTLCQSFAPNHVCTVTPERVGLCGAVSWLDAKAAYEITPTGPNQPIPKGECLDEVKGRYTGVDQFTYTASRGHLESVNLYTLMENPMTSCGCFEAIMVVVPEANGIMIVNREFTGMTPCGMKFSTLAGMVGGGQQTPGFMGIGKSYIISKKFIRADGGLPRVVWMPKELKEFLRAGIEERAKELGIPDLYDKIADETVGTTPEEILPFLEEKGHPALTMDPIM